MVCLRLEQFNYKYYCTNGMDLAINKSGDYLATNQYFNVCFQTYITDNSFK